MSRRILKFTVMPDLGNIETADEPTFLAVGWQGENLVVWCEATVGIGVRTAIAVIPTGQAAPSPDDHARFIGTAQTDAFGSTLVMHVYAQDRAP